MMKRKMIKKSVFAATMAMAIFGMAGTASAEYWFCQMTGEDFSDPDNNKGVEYISGVFYSSEKVYTSDFLNSIHLHAVKVRSLQSSCLSSDTHKEAKHSRDDSINMSAGMEIRYSGFDG